MRSKMRGTLMRTVGCCSRMSSASKLIERA